jgi:hypothetical protein
MLRRIEDFDNGPANTPSAACYCNVYHGVSDDEISLKLEICGGKSLI